MESPSSPEVIRRPTQDEILQKYKPGSIRRVKLKNFLTYSDVEFFPGPRLNMVVGPNGTGKSTILCAICLGLGGQPPLLGRADDARLFIMHDRERAMIEIELAPHFPTSNSSRPSVHVIRRDIDRNKGSEKGKGAGASTYFINNQKSSLKEVRRLVSEVYHISVDNLCTFLPQDRVGSFSGFDAQLLLQETEKSLSGSKHLYDTHMQLIELENELRSSGNSVETIGEKLRRLEAENESLERMKNLMEERAKHQKQMELLEQKRVWVLFDAERQNAITLRDRKSELKAAIKKAKEGIRPLEERHAKLTSDMDRMKARFKTVESGMRRAVKEHDKNLRKADTFHDEIEKHMGELSSIDSLRRQAERAVAKQKKKVEDLEAQMSDYPPEEEINQALAEAQAEIRVVKSKLEKARRETGRITSQVKDLADKKRAAEARLAKMEDDQARRKERIFRQQPKLGETFQWLDQNRKMFRKKVWGPIVCEITPKGANSAAYVEQHVANSVLKSFVVECEEDYNLLYREVRQKRKLFINVINIEGGKLEAVKRMYSDGKMKVLKKDHGIMGYLDESFTAPDPVLEALRRYANVQSVLVGSSATQTSLDRHGLLDYLSERERGDNRPGLLGACVFSCHQNRSYKYTAQPSRYSGKLSLRVDDIMPAKMLAPGVNPEHKKALATEIQEMDQQIEQLNPKAQEAQDHQDDVTSKGQAISQRLKDAKAAKNDLKNFQMKVTTATRKLKEYEEEASKDKFGEKESILEKLERNVVNSISALEMSAKNHRQIMESTYTLAGVKMTEDGLAASARRAQDELSEKKSVSSSLEEDHAEVSAEFNESKQTMKDLKAQAESIAPIKDADGNDLPLKAELNELPETLDEVEAALEEATSRVNSITDNPEVLRQYEERKEEIARTREEMEGLSEAQDAKRALMDNTRIPWEAALINCVKKVDVLFGQYMKELGCAGEVRLYNGQPSRKTSSERTDPADEDSQYGNFKGWGIQILVKFRESSPLQILSAQVHSGGERSVSTIMYLMALQELMVSPFRCVDEINQGLDERNERLVFKRIVENSTTPSRDESIPSSHSGQYFLITPKLLPNLTDMEEEEVTVLFIFNGSFNFKHFSDWNTEKFIEDQLETRSGRVKRAHGVDETSEKENVYHENEADQGYVPRKNSVSQRKKRRVSD